MKKVLSMVLAFVMVFSLVPVPAAQGAEVSAQVEKEGINEALAAQLSGDGGGDFQVSAVEAEAPDEVRVTYAAAADCSLVLTVTGEDGEEQLARTETAVSAGTAQVTVSTGLDAFPQYYRITAALYMDGAAVSEEFVNADHTRAYEEFLAMTPEDEAFAGQTVLDLGIGSDGNSNFAVVREDVRVVTVSSIEETLPDAALMDGEGEDGYLLPAQEEQIVPGDKVLILPADDFSGAVALVAGEVDSAAALLEDGTGAVAVTPANVETDVEDFYSYIRMNVEFTAGTEDLDTSCADPIVEFDEATLFDAGEFGGSKPFTIGERNFNGVRVNDTLTLSVNGRISFEFSGGLLKKLKKFEVTTTLAATNVFTVKAGSRAKLDRTVRVGEIPIAEFIGISLRIPVDVVFEATLNAEFEFTATQNASTTINAGYQSGGCYCTAESHASSGRELKTQARATASVGVKAGLEITVLGMVKADVSGEVGVLAEVIAQSVNDTADYKHDCLACMDVSLYVYAKPSFSLRMREYLFFGDYKDLASKTGSTTRSKILGFYVSYRGGNDWRIGYGTCPNKRYRVTVTVLDGATSHPLSGVAVEKLGTTGKDGKVSGFLGAGQYYSLALKRGGYEDDWVGFYVNASPVSVKASLFLKNNNEAVTYTMREWSKNTDEELAQLIQENLKEGIQVTVADAKELELLATYTIAGKPTQSIEFYVNTQAEQIDLSGVDWVPVGNETHPFQGIFNGAGVTFSGLHVPDDPQNRTNYRGFFGAVGDGAWVHDLTLSNVALTGGEGRPVGAVADVAKGGAEISDVTVSGTVSGACAGGIAGQAEDAVIRNSYVNRLTVTGSPCAGGIAGAYTFTAEGEIANCYSAAQVSGEKAGALCGTVTAAAAALQDGETPMAEQNGGLKYTYYLASGGPAFGETTDGLQPLVFALSEEQAKGTDSAQPISGDPTVPYAGAATLLEALNLWYADFGAYVKASAALAAEEGEEQPGVQEVPDADPQDKYNHWFADVQDTQGEFANDGYPVFAARQPVYPLTVHYSYADGSEAKPTVVLYYEEGAAYDVDSYKLEGFYTNDVEYKGLMPGYPLDFFVVYYAQTVYAGSAKELTGDRSAAAGEIYRVTDEADLRGLAAYTARGGNTTEVEFEQTADLTVTGSWQGIGTADSPFRGSYEGAGYRVTGLDAALFGHTEGAEIQNVTLEAQIEAWEDAGMLAVRMKDSRLANCAVSGSLTSAGSAGGIAVQLENTQAEACEVEADILGGTGAGGLATASTGSTLRNCAFTGTVQADAGNAGGLTGTAKGGALENSSVSAAVTGRAAAGGIAGSASGLKLRNVFFAGTVSGAAQVDAITPAPGADVTAENVFYQPGLTSALTGAQAFQEEGAAKLAEQLNAWVQRQNSARYYLWALEQPSTGLLEETGEDHSPVPVLSLPYENWLLDLTLEDGTVSYTFDRYRYGQFTVMVALYDGRGKMLAFREIPEGQDSFTVSEAGCVYARAFLVDEYMAPVAAAVSSN